MAAEFVVVGRLALPVDVMAWTFRVENAEGTVDVYETRARYDETELAKMMGWTPHSIVFVGKAWDLARVVAEELAFAVEGAVFCDIDNDVFFDAVGRSRPVKSFAEIEQRLKSAFNNPEPFFRRWDDDERSRFQSDPATKTANDWSDV